MLVRTARLPPASPSPPVWWPTCWRPPAWTRSSPSTCTRAGLQGFFDVPVTHLAALFLLGDYFKKNKDLDWDDTVVVSPDMGRAKAAKKLSDYLGCDLAIAHKGRPKHNVSEVMGIIGDIKGKTCIVNDDMIDTAGTLCGSVKKLKEMGAGDIYVCATHGIFSGPAIRAPGGGPHRGVRRHRRHPL